MSSSVDDLPSWGKTIAGGAAFLAVLLASQMMIVWQVTGEWGGTPNDPLWVGPVSAGCALLNTFGTAVAAIWLGDSWAEVERG